MGERIRVASGVSQLDRLLGGLFIGDNVVWHDDAGSLASVFCLNFLQASQIQNEPIVYVSFDRSPRNLLEKLGPLGNNPYLTVLDCFTYGKGAKSDVFLKFYEDAMTDFLCRIIMVQNPGTVESFTEAFYGIHSSMEGNVRFVFESLTGMQELWGSEDHITNFYAHSCPRLYELNTVAYWILEKRAHSPRFRAKITQITQVAIELSVKRGSTYLTIVKAEKRNLDTLNRSFRYWSKDLNVNFELDKRRGGFDLGMRLKELRVKRGLSQTELASLVGVTPSTISQVESNLVYPSLPALLKMAEVLSVEVKSFFQEKPDISSRVIFPEAEAVEIRFPDLPEGSIKGKLLTPLDTEPKAEPYLINIPPHKNLPSHFFIHKGEELGYLIAGKLQMKLQKAVYNVKAGDVIHLTSEIPTQWKNPGPGRARLLWLKIL